MTDAEIIRLLRMSIELLKAHNALLEAELARKHKAMSPVTDNPDEDAFYDRAEIKL